MSDRSCLRWPFFDASHRELVLTLQSWAEEYVSDTVGLDEEDKQNEYELACHIVSWLGKDGFLRYCVPSRFGGAFPHLDVRCICLIRETLARFSGLADFAFAMQGLGSGPVSLFGSEELKQKYLPGVAAGELISTFAISEEEAGSDVSAIETSATKDGSEYVLNGSKTWISNAGIADIYVVFARTGEAPGAKGLSAFLVESETPGFEVTEQIRVTSPHPLGSLAFENCRVPVENMIGKPGEGFKIAMATLDVFRASVGAAALGFARRALDEALSYTSQRQLFGQKLSDFQMTQDSIATMATEIDASALLVYRAAWAKDNGAERVTREAAMAKMYATEAAQRVVDTAVQLLGGRGVSHGSVVERLYRDVRPLRIYEGATEIQKIVIARQVFSQFETSQGDLEQ